jgi:alkylation response protein AidB-like acyl-CoA dehydrogenase
MDFGLSEEQRLLEATVRRYLEEHLPVSRVREIIDSESGSARDVWTGFAELGIPGLLVPEKHGGAGLGSLDAAIVSQIMGHGAAPLPFVESSVMAAVALREGTPAQQSEWLPRIVSAEAVMGVAASEAAGGRDDPWIRVDGKRLHGRAFFALDGGEADLFLVAASSEGLALVPRDSKGLTVERLTTVDRTRRVAELVLEGVEPADWIGGPDGGARAIERMLDAGRVALAADTLGACDRALSMSVEYAKQRHQFGRPIGSFQAVKHMCSEMVAEVEPARSMVWYASHAFDEIPEEAPVAIALAKSHLSEVGTEVLRTATEVHGGIGFTDEHDLQLWFKRVELNRQLLGGPSFLRERAARLQGWEAA